MSFTLHGLPVSGGIAIGQAHLISQATLEVSHLVIAPRMVEKEVARFDGRSAARARGSCRDQGRTEALTGTTFGVFIDLH
jgi:phosphotransferase system enzyme I (PtsI)